VEDVKGRKHTLSDFTNETLEGEFADEQLGGFLVTTDFTKSDGSGPEAMGLLDTSRDAGGSLASLLGSELFARRFSSGRLAGGLLLESKNCQSESCTTTATTMKKASEIGRR
jgi:hypothetical protein